MFFVLLFFEIRFSHFVILRRGGAAREKNSVLVILLLWEGVRAPKEENSFSYFVIAVVVGGEPPRIKLVFCVLLFLKFVFYFVIVREASPPGKIIWFVLFSFGGTELSLQVAFRCPAVSSGSLYTSALQISCGAGVPEVEMFGPVSP